MKKQLMTGLFTVLALTAGAQTFQEWRNPEINAVNRAPMHTNYFAFENADAAKKADKKQSTNYMTLNGTWKFNWVKDADSRPTDFWKTGFNDKGWDDLQVPAVWELNGYGDPIYVNVGYAWRNQFQNNPPEVPTENNHVGSYRREIVVPASWKGKDIIAHFGSVTSNMYLWVNGRYVGYSEDSKLEAEFDLTPYLKPGQKNLIAFQVFRWCDGTYLEDQDFFRYSGVGRDCYLYARNKKRIQDIRVTPDLDAAYQNGSLAVNLDLKGSGKVDLELVDAQGKQVATATANDEMEWRGDVWNHEAMLRDSTLEGQAPLEAGTPTLGSVMQQAGYATAMIGKWGVGGPATEGTPNKMGFGTYYGCICQRQAHTYYPPFLWQNDRRVYLDNELLPPGTPLDAGADPYDPRSYDKYTQRTYSPDAMYDQVLEFVNANKERPFFLMWTTPIPHSPMQAPDADVQYYVLKFGDEQPIEGKGYFPSRWPRATYAAMITYFDRQIGGLVAELKRLGIWENTVIVITSDNGPASNSCSSSEWFDSAHPFRSGKGWGKSSLREGGIRMPFIVAWGGKLRPQVSDHVGYFPDVMPTLCELAGVEPPATDGISFLPALEGRRQPQHEYLYWEFPGSKGWVAVRWGEWKGLLRRVKEGNDRFELFNLSDDPREEHDLAAQHPEIIDRMWQFVSASHTEPANPKFRMEVGRK